MFLIITVTGHKTNIRKENKIKQCGHRQPAGPSSITIILVLKNRGGSIVIKITIITIIIAIITYESTFFL